MRWYVKVVRSGARFPDGSLPAEVWREGEVCPTLNAFDIGDTRTAVIVFHPHRSDGARIQGDTINTLTSFMGTGGLNTPMIAYSIREDAKANTFSATETDTALALQGLQPSPQSHHAQLFIAKTIGFSHTQGLDAQPSEDNFPTLRTGGGGMAVAYDEYNDSISETHHTLRSGTKQSTGVLDSTVRRLTPVECERLQGFPDDWTDGQADSHRYKQMGNAVTVNVTRWIGERLNEA